VRLIESFFEVSYMFDEGNGAPDFIVDISTWPPASVTDAEILNAATEILGSSLVTSRGPLATIRSITEYGSGRQVSLS